MTVLVRAVIGVAITMTGCIWGTRDSYRCDSDLDCNTGAAGRCEVSKRCTVYDPSCDTERRYTAHSEELSDLCFDDRVVPLNACASGQPPALPTECFADVCDALPTCCQTGWTDACVLEAQLRCPDLQCQTHLALTASKGGVTELWDVQWGPIGWTAASPPMRQQLLVWVPPAPGTVTPRLASLYGGGTGVVVGEQLFEVTARPYQDLAAVDFDRDGRATLTLSSGDATHPFTVEVIKLDDDTRREVATPATQRMVWADYDHDAFPDLFAFAGGGYYLIRNYGPEGAPRSLAAISTSSVPNGAANNTPMTAAVHGIELGDLDRDHLLDLVVSGNTIRAHMTGNQVAPLINDQSPVSIDCDPPAAPGVCTVTSTALTSTMVPSLAGTELFVGLFPDRVLYRGGVSASPPGATLGLIAIPQPCPGCPGFIGMFARDLDGDHRIDVIAIDTDLGFVTLLARDNYAPMYSRPIATMLTGVTSVKLSVTGFTP